MKFSYPSGSNPLEGYTIKRGIGIGGFGEVYFALSDAGKEVALKKIQRNLDVELRGVRQCLNLKHVNLISLWDIRINEFGESWVVMEYVPGPSLRDAVEASPTGMPEEQIKTWFTSIASGVSYLHEHGIVHRDLKPGNIFCDEDEQVIKIGDYGLSKFISCSRRSGQTESVGTFHYMAPEIGKGVYGKEIDIYALGIILYEMLTGDVPFEGESSQEIIMKHLTANPDVDRVPEGFRRVISKALRKDPELRYSTVPELAADLPWPEIAENSKKIISQQSVGPMVAGNGSLRATRDTEKHPGLEAESQSTEQDKSLAAINALPRSADLSKLPPVIISGEKSNPNPGIVFGPLTDNSTYPNADRNSAASPAFNSGLGNRRSNEDPIRVIHSTHSSGSVRADASLLMSNTAHSISIPPVVSNTAPPAGNAGAIAADGTMESEPIATALQSGMGRVSQWWNNANVSTPVKIILLIVAGMVVVQNSTWLLPFTLTLGIVYLLYYVGRTAFLDNEAKPKKTSPKEQQRLKIARVRSWLGMRPSADKISELVGSMLVGAFACIVLNLLGLALGGGILNSSVEAWANYAWLTLTCVLATWVLLCCSKLWEQENGEGTDGLMRRLVLVGLGLVVGAIAFFSAGSFNLDLANLALADFQARQTENFVFHGIPILPAYLIFFAGLFGLLRWWRQSDPVRKTRLSILSVTICLIWATIFSHLLSVPLTASCILAVVISVSVQLASPWLHPTNQLEIAEQTSSRSLV
ncbi:MAG: serine/threonine protein kinase [Mariniblastus sp.]